MWTGEGWIGRRAVQIGAVSLGYVGMALLALFGLAMQDIGLVVFGCGACVLSVVVALVRPRGEPVAAWTVLVATWALGVAMSTYGYGYVVAAVSEVGSEFFLVYLITGGASWLSGGVLFVATALLASRSKASSEIPTRHQVTTR